VAESCQSTNLISHLFMSVVGFPNAPLARTAPMWPWPLRRPRPWRRRRSLNEASSKWAAAAHTGLPAAQAAAPSSPRPRTHRVRRPPRLRPRRTHRPHAPPLVSALTNVPLARVDGVVSPLVCLRVCLGRQPRPHRSLPRVLLAIERERPREIRRSLRSGQDSRARRRADWARASYDRSR